MKVEATKDAMVQAFARAVEQEGGKALLVGGLVRDELLGLPSKDYDFEVFGLDQEKLKEILSRFGNVKEVGKQFGVLHIQELDWDIALPRREKKVREGHKGFDVVPDPSMTIEEAAKRRDLTINALSKDPLTGEIIDPLGGIADLKQGILRMADPNTFGDDPLRALRTAQFAARFNFDVDPETLEVVAAQPIEELPGERILPEFSKMLLKGKKPSKGIEVLRRANLLRYFPEIENLQGVPQDPEHHPEGDVYVHTLMVIDEAAKQKRGNPDFDLPLMFGALAHDFGKPDNTQEENGRIRALGHEEGGWEPTVNFLKRMKAPNDLIKQVATLVVTHLRPQLMPERAGRKGYRKLGRLLESANVSPELLASVSKADTLGRTTEKAIRKDTRLADKFLIEFHEHVTNTIEPGQKKLTDVVTGKDLIARGMKPGPDMGKFLKLTRAIEDETGLKDPDKIIDLATRFLDSRQEGGGSPKKDELECGDSHIRPGEECYDGEYREARNKGLTKSSQGPSEFRTHPNPNEPDWVLWHEFDWPWKDDMKVKHPGLATAEPQRQHERSITYQPRWFNAGTPRSKRSERGKGSRDGFSGLFPYIPEEHEHAGPPTIPEDITNWESVTPEPPNPLLSFNWDSEPTVQDIGPEWRDEFPNADQFPATHYPADKGAGFLPVELPIPQVLEGPSIDPHPSPMRATDSPPQSSHPGQFTRYPGGGGLDRAPMIHPQGKKKPSGFLPVQNMPNPSRNMFKAAIDIPDSDFDQYDLKRGITDEQEENGLEPKDAKEIVKEKIKTDPDFYERKPRNELDNMPWKNKGQEPAPGTETVEGKPKYGRGGGGNGGYITKEKHGPGGGDDNSREYWDMDFTGKKPGFMSIDPPKENVYKAEAARTREDLDDLDVIFPKDYNPDWGIKNKPEVGPNTKHRNERHVAPDPIQADDDIHQKQTQTLVPNQKLSIAVNPRGKAGERIIMMSPLFEEVSPAIQALRSQRFEDHGAVVVDGPPMWLLGLGPKLEALDKSHSSSSEDLWQEILKLVGKSGLTVDYTQKPRI